MSMMTIERPRPEFKEYPLCRQDVVAIKRMFPFGYSDVYIAKRVGVLPTTINDIRTGKKWGWV
jgi:hypothetical protein